MAPPVDKKAEAALRRAEMLVSWKERKALKRKLEKENARPIFKVCKVADRQPIYMPSEQQFKNSLACKRKWCYKQIRNAATLKVAATKPSDPRAKRESFAPPEFEFAAPSGVQPFEMKVEADSAAHSESSLIMGSFEPLKIISTVQLNSNDVHGSEDAMTSVTKSKPLLGGGVDHDGAFLAVETGSDIPTVNSDATDLNASTGATAKHQSLEFSSLINNPWITVSRGRSTQHRAENFGSEQVPVVKDLDDIPLSADETLTLEHFRSLLATNLQTLKFLGDSWFRLMKEIENIDDNVVGRIRTAIEQSDLLVSEQLQQFSDFIEDCDLHCVKNPTMCRDLQGFWEILNIQVEDVLKQFTALEELKNQDWADGASVKKAESAAIEEQVVVPSSPVLLPFLDILSISSGKVQESPRLSELFSPLRAGRPRASMLQGMPENTGCESSPLISFDEMEVTSPRR